MIKKLFLTVLISIFCTLTSVAAPPLLSPFMTGRCHQWCLSLDTSEDGGVWILPQQVCRCYSDHHRWEMDAVVLPYNLKESSKNNYPTGSQSTHDSWYSSSDF